MNIDSYREVSGSGYRLYIQVPIPADYTPEERKYAQEELVRLTYLSMYKIIDKIGLDRENESQRLREAQQEEERREARGSRSEGVYYDYRTGGFTGSRPLYSGPNGDYTVPASEEAPQAPSEEAEAVRGYTRGLYSRCNDSYCRFCYP
jgi:hypothetical protein